MAATLSLKDGDPVAKIITVGQQDPFRKYYENADKYYTSSEDEGEGEPDESGQKKAPAVVTAEQLRKIEAKSARRKKMRAKIAALYAKRTKMVRVKRLTSVVNTAVSSAPTEMQELTDKQKRKLKLFVRRRERPSGKYAMLAQAYDQAVAAKTQERGTTSKVMTEYSVPLGKQKLFPLPQHSYFNYYVAAPSGSGKSTYIGTLLRECGLRWPECRIFIFSAKDSDPAYANIMPKPIYCRVDESIVENPMNIAEFAGKPDAPTILVFDDIERIDGKEIDNALRLFLDQCLETGRSSHISCICVSHIIRQGLKTQRMINECMYATLFPGTNFRAVQGLVKEYYGFGQEEIEKIRSLRSSSVWVTIHRNFPCYIVHEHGVQLV